VTIENIQQGIEGFVDDTSLFINLDNVEDSNDINQLHEKLRHDMTERMFLPSGMAFL
jgi:hypothetical protein